MKRVIYSIYIDIPKDKLDAQPPHQGDTEDKNLKAKREFAENYEWLLERQRQYAEHVGAEFIHYTYDQKYIDLEKWYNEKYPVVTTYNIVNFYKIHLMYELKDQYDEILYMDLDVVPITKLNFFDEHDLSKGVAIRKNDVDFTFDLESVKRRNESIKKDSSLTSIRSPEAKWWNSVALTHEYENPCNDLPVYNTGIVGINKFWLEKINYFEDFDELLHTMNDLKTDEYSMWPEYTQSLFGWDN